MRPLSYTLSHISPHTFSVQWEPTDSILIQDNQTYFIQTMMRSKLLNRLKTNTHGFTFEAERVLGFPDYVKQTKATDLLDYDTALKCIASIVPFLHGLEQTGFTFSCLEPEKMIVVDDSIFLYIGIEYMVPIGLDRTKRIVCRNIPIHPLSAPEIRSHTPSVLYCESFYYSLAAFMQHNMIPLDRFRETSLYWFIARNLSFDPCQRNLSFI